MASWSQLLTFAGVVLVGAMSPGPDFAVVLRHAATSGRRAGTATALGITAGVAVWSLGTAIGVAALLAASAVAFTVVKLVGAAYLGFLGVKALLAACRAGPPVEVAAGAGTSVPRAFREGLLCNVLNPKCAVFFVALLPQFLPADPTPADTALVSAVPVVLTALWFVVVANVVGALRRLLAARRVRQALDAATGTLLIAVGLRLAVQGRSAA
ncbi:threonine/homoserine/homoserine lactone efflux protein [Prauserella shujinwangii]|uniref:Threonine/homoserine/homoserine lactone efflux protein n=1 Tax=Prauserella shujinwangii TaxID=1453103 RepID=A0A2T0LVJ9_9PSEU|nr:LysE family transporter [Prauserella shujinwangii]PRX47873.1 threonine/homoserine/homoserine lactone efflux protein [Prauserella shujinwangii]